MHATNSHVLPYSQAVEYIMGGHGKATLVGQKSRFTFKFDTPKDKDFPIFVKVLSGPDNESAYQFIGVVTNQGNLHPGKKGHPDAPSYQALNWYLRTSPEKASAATFIHEGKCCRCGKTLTVPSSIEIGMGPSCASKV